MSADETSGREAKMVRAIGGAVLELEGQLSSISAGKLQLIMNGRDISQSYAADLEDRISELRELIAGAESDGPAG